MFGDMFAPAVSVLVLSIGTQVLTTSALTANNKNQRSTRTISGQPVYLGEQAGKRYFFINSQGTWLNALDFCHLNSFNAIEIEAQTELEFVGSIIRQKGPWKFNYFWSTGHDFFPEGTYRWLKSNKTIDRRLNNLFDSSSTPRANNCVQLPLKDSNVNVLFDYVCSNGEVQRFVRKSSE